MYVSRICFFLLIVFMAFSCTVQKRLPNSYLENIADTTGKGLLVSEQVIQKNDLLSIQVYSASTKPEIDALYNMPVQAAGGATAITGFLVDVNGNIEFPRLGTIKAEGLTKTQLTGQIKEKLQGQLTNPTVIIRFLQYKVTILGEVNSPGSFTVPTERVTILEALGLAGDVTEFGKRNNVKILRESNGERQIGTIDLTSKEMFNSPFYQLQQNDVVIVAPTSQRVKQRDNQQLATQIGIATSILTGIALILNVIK